MLWTQMKSSYMTLIQLEENDNIETFIFVEMNAIFLMYDIERWRALQSQATDIYMMEDICTRFILSVHWFISFLVHIIFKITLVKFESETNFICNFSNCLPLCELCSFVENWELRRNNLILPQCPMKTENCYESINYLCKSPRCFILVFWFQNKFLLIHMDHIFLK